jgi:hypothetical protein
MDSVWKLFWWLSKGQTLREKIKTFHWLYEACCRAKYISRGRTLQALTEHDDKFLIVPLNEKRAKVVVGGPYARYQDYRVGVCLAPEVLDRYPINCDVLVDWPDFGIPDEYEVKQALVETAIHLNRNNPVYVGCMGGIGRTGTFLALLCKMGGETIPVAYVRKHYLSHAVETDQQMNFIRDFDVDGLS